MANWPVRILLGATFFASTGSAVHADAVSDFYTGKNVIMQIGSSPGGIYDIVGRSVSRHMPKYIPGQPKMVVQIVPGGGSLPLANQFGAITPRDGTVFGVFNNGMPTTPLTSPSVAKFNPRLFRYMGSTSREAHILVVWHNSPVQTMEELFTKELIVGASAPGAAPFDFPLLTNVVIGTKFKIVKGYQGGPETQLAMRRGEIFGNPGLALASYKTDYLDAIKNNEVKIIAAFGMKKHADLQDVPLLPVGKTPEERQLFELMYARQDYGRIFATPPDVPDDRFFALRGAFEKTMKDKDFLEEADKLKLDIAPVSGQELAELTERIYSTPQAVIERMRKITSSEN